MSNKGPGSKGSGVSGGGLKARIANFMPVGGEAGKMTYHKPGSQNPRKGFSKKERVKRGFVTN